MWTLNGTRIYVQDIPEAVKNVVARLQPINSSSIHQKFGYESKVIKLGGIIVGNTDRDALEALVETDTTYTLVTPEGSITGLIVVSVTARRRPTVYQTMRTDLDCESPVYDVDIELYQD